MILRSTADEASSGDREEVSHLSRMRLRSQYIRAVIENSLDRNAESIDQATITVERWLRERAVIRIIGYGRARLAAGIPGNRLAHAGGVVSTLGDITPLASTTQGGGLIAASSSGLTPQVLEVLATCRRRAPHVTILGLAIDEASEFQSLCDVFIGISKSSIEQTPDLLYFGDAVEYAISEILDSVVAAALERAGLTEYELRHGHEDLGGTGPYTLPEEGRW